MHFKLDLSMEATNTSKPKLQRGTQIFAYIRRLGPFVLVQNSDFQQKNMGWEGASEKMNVFGDMKILWIVFLGGHHKIGLL